MNDGYACFLAFLLDNGDENSAIKKGLIELKPRDGRRAVLTGRGCDVLLAKLWSFFENPSQLSSKRVVHLSKILFYGQLHGGKEFIKRFRSGWKALNIDDEILYLLEAELPGAASGKNNAFEEPYEAEWRRKLYSACVDIISGYETYQLYQPPTLCFESLRVLPGELIYLLDALLLCNPLHFSRLCREQGDPVWPLRVIDRGPMDTLDDELLLDDVITVASELNGGQQGVFVAHLWDYFQRVYSGFRHRGLEMVLQALGPGKMLQALSRVAADLSRESFPESYSGPRDKHREQRERLNSLVQWLGAWVEIGEVANEVVLVNFIDNLYGRVNCEAKWVGLLLARELRTKGKKETNNLASIIEDRIINCYPHYWEKGVGQNSGLFFSGQQTLQFIDELARALLQDRRPVAIFSWLSKVEAIASPAKLWQYRDLHLYDKYLNEQRRTVIHALLTIKVINLLLAEGKAIPAGYLEGVLNFLAQLSRELPTNHHINSEQLILDALFFNLGSLLKNVNHWRDFLDAFLLWLDNPRYYVRLLAGVNKEDMAGYLRNELKQILPVQKHLLRDVEKLDMGRRLFKTGNYDLALELLLEIEAKRLDHHQFKYWKNITAQVYIGKAMLQDDAEQQINFLEMALHILEKSSVFNAVDDEDLRILKLQILGWLVDRSARDWADFFKAYNLISLNGVINGNYSIEDISPGRQYVCALSLVRILNVIKKDACNIREQEMKILCHNMVDLPGQEGVQLLIKAWYADRQGCQEDALNWLDKLLPYAAGLQENKEWLPKPLAEYLR